MSKSTKQKLGALTAVPFMGILMVGSAAAAPETCNWKTARDYANAGDYAALCDCAQVTPSFLERLQSRSDFETTLTVTGAQCPGLAALLTDLPTASISNAASTLGEDRSSDRNAPGAGQVADAGSGGGSAGPGGGGGNDGPGDSGGNDGPGDGGGNDGPGDGGGSDGPGDGGGKPGEGKPGKGGGKGGDGPGKGKGGGKGGDGPGKGKGGGKGNNGHGNGSEGSSPGRGNNANDDEGGGGKPGKGGGKR